MAYCSWFRLQYGSSHPSTRYMDIKSTYKTNNWKDHLCIIHLYFAILLLLTLSRLLLPFLCLELQQLNRNNLTKFFLKLMSIVIPTKHHAFSLIYPQCWVACQTFLSFFFPYLILPVHFNSNFRVEGKEQNKNKEWDTWQCILEQYKSNSWYSNIVFGSFFTLEIFQQVFWYNTWKM